MKTILSALLMLLSLLIGFQQTIIVAHFEQNKDFIAQHFCINRDRPELQCQGSCYLKKQLQETEHSESGPGSIRMQKTADLFPVSTGSLLVNLIALDFDHQLPVYQEPHYMEPYREIFVPPQ